MSMSTSHSETVNVLDGFVSHLAEGPNAQCLEGVIDEDELRRPTNQTTLRKAKRWKQCRELAKPTRAFS
jgi:hypothetical protein